MRKRCRAQQQPEYRLRRVECAGTYLGRPVHVTIVDGGCDLSRWAKLKAVFG